MNYFSLMRYRPILAVIFYVFLVVGLVMAQDEAAHTATLKIKVNSNNRPIIGALVTLKSSAAGRQIAEQGYTNEAGEYEFTQLPAGTYSYEVSKRAFFKDTVTSLLSNNIALGRSQSQTLTVSIIKGGVITGRILDMDSSNLWGIPVTAIKLEAGARAIARHQRLNLMLPH